MNRCQGCGKPSGLRWRCGTCIGLLRTRNRPPLKFSAAYLSPSGEWWIATRLGAHNDLAGVINERARLGLDDAQVGLDDRGWQGVHCDGCLRRTQPMTDAQARALLDWATVLEAGGLPEAAERARRNVSAWVSEADGRGWRARRMGEERPRWLRAAAVLVRERTGD